MARPRQNHATGATADISAGRLLIGWLNSGRRRNAVAEAMLCYYSDFLGKLITNPPKDAATTIAQQNLAEAAHNVSADFCRLLLAHRRNGAPAVGN
jgi:hypothetical protein